MASYVIDATVVIHRLLRHTYTPNAIALFKQLQPPHHLYVPEFCLLEAVNVLWKYVRFQGMPQADAERLVNDLFGLPLELTPVTGLYVQALQLGLKHQLAVYDSVYIALAKHLNYPLITIDQSQSKAAAAEGIAVVSITQFQP
jgi:predicted nucleic acid-binding protein